MSYLIRCSGLPTQINLEGLYNHVQYLITASDTQCLTKYLHDDRIVNNLCQVQKDLEDLYAYIEQNFGMHCIKYEDYVDLNIECGDEETFNLSYRDAKELLKAHPILLKLNFASDVRFNTFLWLERATEKDVMMVDNVVLKIKESEKAMRDYVAHCRTASNVCTLLR